MNTVTMSRWKAAGIHLTLCIALALCITALIYLLWFPPPYFVATGAPGLMLLIIGVDVAIGPLLTLLVFNAAKPKRLLKLDLSVIALLQAVAFAYGLYVICQARPVFVVAVVDRLKIIAADELSDADLAKGPSPEFRQRSWIGPKYAGADPTHAHSAELILQAASGGKDIDQLPQFYVPYDLASSTLMQHARPLAELKTATPVQQSRLQLLTAKAQANGDTLLYVPLQSRKTDYTAVISTHSGRPIAILATDPW